MTRRVKVIFTRRGDADFTAILHSLADLNESAAIKLNKRFAFRFKMLSKSPELGARCPEYGRDLRRTVVGLYVVYYRIEESQVEIVRIIHGYRDHGPLLEDDE